MNICNDSLSIDSNIQRKIEEIIEFFSALQSHQSFDNIVDLFLKHVLYNREIYNSNNSINTNTRKRKNDTNEDLIYFNYKIENQRHHSYEDNITEIYSLSLYNSIFIKIFTNIKKIKVTYKFTTLENFYKCKKLLKGILYLYNYFNNNKNTTDTTTSSNITIINSEFKHSILEIDKPQVKYFLYSLEEIFKYYHMKLSTSSNSNSTKKNNIFDMFNQTVFTINIFKSNIQEELIISKFILLLSCEFIHNTKKSIEFKAVVIDNYKFMCKTLRDKIFIFNDRIMDKYIKSKHSLTDDFLFVICESEDKLLFNKVKSII